MTAFSSGVAWLSTRAVGDQYHRFAAFVVEETRLDDGAYLVSKRRGKRTGGKSMS